MALTTDEERGDLVWSKEYIVRGQKVVCNFYNGAYRNASPEEIARRVENMKRVAAKLLWQAELRKLQEAKSKITQEGGQDQNETDPDNLQNRTGTSRSDAGSGSRTAAYR